MPLAMGSGGVGPPFMFVYSGGAAPPAPPAITVSSIANDTVTEGEVLEHLVTLSGTTWTPTTYAISWGGGTLDPSEYASLPLFTDGVIISAPYNNIVVPSGVSSFTIRWPTFDDGSVESSETLLFTIGGVSATGTVLDNDSVGNYCPLNSHQAYIVNNGSYPLPANWTDSSFNMSQVDMSGFLFPPPGNGYALVGNTTAYIQYDIPLPLAKKYDSVYVYGYGSMEIRITDENANVRTLIVDRQEYWDSFVTTGSHVGGFGSIASVKISFNATTGFQGFAVQAVELFCSNNDLSGFSSIYDGIISGSPAQSYLMLEDDTFLLLESGDKILLEAQ